MVQFPTNGHGTDDERPDARSAQSARGSASRDGGHLDGDVEVLARGSTLGRYLVLERIGAGAMGVVYAAYDPELDRKVAIKILRPQAGAGDHERRRARLVREAKAIARLSHPNIVSIFDVGEHDDQVFLAMEYLGGGTLRQWMVASKRPWREVLDMFAEIGKGLAAAHAEGLVHRDFKPDNVLLDKSGKPKVVDFGLVRLATGRDLTSSSGDDLPHEEPPADPVDGAASGLTRTGALAGTPAYMAPEQFLARSIDARTDQFAFCVALFEALYGVRPFEGENVIALADSVIDNRVRPALKNNDTPGWVRACVLRGLSSDPGRRYAGVAELLADLGNDPAVRWRRRYLVVGATLVVTLAFVVARQLIIGKRREIDRQAAAAEAAADGFLTSARSARTESEDLRGRSLVAFDNFDGAEGEKLWERSLTLANDARHAYEQAIQQLEAAVNLASQPNVRARTAEALVSLLGLTVLSAPDRQAAIRRLAEYDDGGNRVRRLNAPAHITLKTEPEGLGVRAEKYDPSTFRPSGAPRTVGTTPVVLDLEPGSYRFVIEGDGERTGFNYPVLLGAGERFEESIKVPRKASVPAGFEYIPAGRFLFGSGDEELRVEFLETVPVHEVRTGPFLISRYETTIGDWLNFLDALPEKEREVRRPQGRKDGQGGFVDVRMSVSGGWEMRFRATNRTYVAKTGEPFKYDERKSRAVQNWLRFPVAGISPEDARVFTAWLDRSGRVPGARLCTEREWERAARGADGRAFPHGSRLLTDDADFDVTYGRRSAAYGPDEVGSHAASVSPFGIYDMVGNAWDIATSVLDEGQYVARGGSFYQNLRTQLSANRDPISATTRDQTIGLRVCGNVAL
jgi:formylglycine-generating enzyme required for sulfatase activity